MEITVEVYSRRAGDSVSEGVHWECTGEAEFSVESVEKADRGTKIVLHLKDDALEYADGFRLRSLIKKYSDHISLPVEMLKEAEPVAPGAEGEEEVKGQDHDRNGSWSST